MFRLGVNILIIYTICIIGCYCAEHFKVRSCYDDNLDNLDNRMPLDIENLIALIEKYERVRTPSNIHEIAGGIIKEYQDDGYTYSYETSNKWGPHETEETDKAKVLKNILLPSFEIVEGTFDPREECSLHFMTSHSMDSYRHTQVGNFWDDSHRRRRRSDSNTASRSIPLPNGMDPAEHPIENGVIHTYWGPVAGGSLISGLASIGSTSSNSIQQILKGSDIEYMPSEMKSKVISPVVYAATLAGDVAQYAMNFVDKDTNTDAKINAGGKFVHQTACPRLYMQEKSDISYLTRAEIFGGLDALLINKGLEDTRSSKQLKLSQVLRMYYSDVGLPGNQNYKACNRLQLFQDLDKNKIKEQALYFMYALSSEDPNVQTMIENSKDDFSQIESYFKTSVEKVWKALESFISGDARTYPECPIYNTNDIIAESIVDLVVVMGQDSTGQELEHQRQYVAHVARKIGVDYHGSRLAILEPKTNQWSESHQIMYNQSNIADWACNFTVDNQAGGSTSTDTVKILQTIWRYYKDEDIKLRNDKNSAGGNSQVLLWNLPKNIKGDQEDFRMSFRNFVLNFPEVLVLGVAKSKADYGFMMENIEEDFFQSPASEDSLVIENMAEKVAQRISKAPALFIYPACDVGNVTYDGYSEQSHSYIGYVSPNHTTFLKIGAKTFHFSEEVYLEFEGSSMEFCASRTDRFPKEGNTNVTCNDGSEKFRFTYPCGRYLYECDDIYVAIKAKGDSTGGSCNAEKDCVFPNQLQFQMNHDGIVCGTSGLLPAPLLLVALILIQIFRN